MPLSGPYAVAEITERVYPNTAGVYVLSRDRRTAAYVGRSDADLQARLRASAGEGHFPYFWFDYASSPMQAFRYECELYHAYNPPTNINHPAVPAGTLWRCPVGGCPWS